MMTKKDFEAIAAILRQYNIGDDAAAGFDEGYQSAFFGIRSDLADYFEKSNWRFDRQTFIEATR